MMSASPNDVAPLVQMMFASRNDVALTANDVRFTLESPNRTYPNYFVHIEWFGFVFYIVKQNA